MSVSENLGTQEVPAPIPAATTPNWRRRTLILTLVSFAASGVIVAASFMPWLSATTGHMFRLSDGSLVQTLSGWDIYESERDAGQIGLLVQGPLANEFGYHPPFFTGLGTVISGLSLVSFTVLSLVLSALSPAFSPRTGRLIIWRLALGAVNGLAVVLVVVPTWMVVFAYFIEHGAAEGASLEYGTFVLCAASVVGFFGMLAAGYWWNAEARKAREVYARRRSRLFPWS